MSATFYNPLILALTGTLLLGQPVKRDHVSDAKKTTAPPIVPEASQSKDASPQELVQTAKVPYNPTLIRDPFSSPSDLTTGVRQESIDEVGIKGRVVMRGKTLAIITDSRGKTRSIPVGYRFKDGEVVAVDDHGVTFRQWDHNSTSRSVFKTVIKSFKREEGIR
jgi:TusA-related sulfurtransferase